MGNATFGHEGATSPYRYRLRRRSPPDLFTMSRTVGFVMLNPSTADATEDDPTVRRCIGFMRAWGFTSLEVGNLFALRSTNPAAILQHADPIGPENDRYLVELAIRCDFIVCAWGNEGSFKGRDLAVRRLLRGYDCRYLSLNKGGQPTHPLYLAADLKPQPFLLDAA